LRRIQSAPQELSLYAEIRSVRILGDYRDASSIKCDAGGFAVALLLVLAALGALLVVWDATRANAPWLKSRNANDSCVVTKPLDRDKQGQA
jgi:hypothetical protein